jgi:hypothetical protein
MSKITAFARLLNHAFTGTLRPTIPTTNDHTDNTWLTTDIYSREMATNPDLRSTWVRHDSNISTIPNLNFTNSFSTTALANITPGIRQFVFASTPSNLSSGDVTLNITATELAPFFQFQILDVQGIIISDAVATQTVHKCDVLRNISATNYTFTPTVSLSNTGGVWSIEINSLATYTDGGITYTNLCNNANFSNTAANVPRAFVTVTVFV